MKTIKGRWAYGLLAAAAALTWAAPATAAHGTALPGTGLANSNHDFTSLSTTTVGLCTFCHTPHRAQQTKLLWNHTLSAETYSWSDTTITTGGTPLPTFDATWQGISKNCLSCHDGTVAIGDVAWFDAQGPANFFNSDHSANNDPFKISGWQTGATFQGDMAGNHPVAHPFPFQGQASTYNSTTNGAAAVDSGWQADPTTLGIRLFVDDGTGNISAGTQLNQTGIECSSCHDPHNTNGKVVDRYFLRGTLTGNDTNYICLKCHAK